MVTASIVTYNTDREQMRTVIRNAADSVIERIYVVDNSFTDALEAFVCALSDKVEYIHGQGNIGYGAAHNIAIRQACARGAVYHVVLNPDIQFEAGDIQRMADYMEHHPEVGWLMPRVVYPNGELQYLCKLLPTPMDLIGRRFLGFLPFVRRRDRRFEMRSFDYDREVDIPFCSGCFMFLRTAALQEVGMFDDRIFMYGEDLDLSRRVYTSARWTTRFWPGTTVIHDHNKESYRSRKLLWIHMKSIIYYFNKYGWFFDRRRRQINTETLQKSCSTSHNS